MILAEGQRDGDIEVLSIDIAKNQVTIMNGTVVTNLTFEAPKATRAPASIPGVTAGPIMAFRAPSPFAPAVPNSPGYASGRGNIVVVGGNPSMAVASAKEAQPVPPPPQLPLPRLARESLASSGRACCRGRKPRRFYSLLPRAANTPISKPTPNAMPMA